MNVVAKEMASEGDRLLFILSSFVYSPDSVIISNFVLCVREYVFVCLCVCVRVCVCVFFCVCGFLCNRVISVISMCICFKCKCNV